MKFHQDVEGPPCKHMEAILQEVADGSAKGLRKFYAISHAGRCFQCGNYLERMKLMIQLMRAKPTESAPNAAIERLRAQIAETVESDRAI